MSAVMKTLKNIGLMSVIQMLTYIFPLITVPYIISILGISAFGVISLVYAYTQYIVLITEYGFNLTGSRQIILEKDKSTISISSIYWGITYTKILLYIISSALFLFLLCLFYDWDSEIMSLSIVACAGALSYVLFPQWLYQGLENFKALSNILIVSRIVSLPFLFLFVNDEGDVVYAMVFMFLPNIVSGVISVWHLFFYVKVIVINQINLKNIKHMLKEGFFVFCSNISVNLYTNSLTVFLGVYYDSSVVGYFSAADRIRLAIQSLVSAVSSVMYPKISFLQTQDKQRATMIMFKSTAVTLIFFVSVSTFFYMNFSYLVNYLYSVDVKLIIDNFEILIWLPCIACVTNSLGVQYMLAYGYRKEFTFCILSGAVFCLAFIDYIFSNFGAVSASYSALSTEIFIMIVMLCVVFYKKDYKRTEM